MRLNSDLIQKSAHYLNPLGQFHLDLRGYRIPYLENLAATNDQYACIDLTDNDITKIDELPQLLRLETLMLANNRISRISKDFAAVCPRLDTIILSGNRLSSFADLDNLPKQLKRLVCIENVVYNLPNYRQYVIYRFPQLKMLDYQKVTKQEREQAEALFSNSDNLDKVYQADKLVPKVSQGEDQETVMVSQQQRDLLAELDRQLELADTLEKIQQIERKIKQIRESNPTL